MTEAVGPIDRRRLWLGLFLAPVAWAVAWGAGYLVVARSCEGDNGLHFTGVAGVRWVDLGIAAVMACVGVAGLLTAIGSVRIARRTHAPNVWWGRELFMASAGVIGSSLFLGGTLLLLVPPFVLNVCNQAR
ncbi:MAG: hypothetical protein ACREPM_15075 [Gemmatimonadaceae bacterium]